jgi:hypothetical protein
MHCCCFCTWTNWLPSSFIVRHGHSGICDFIGAKVS